MTDKVYVHVGPHKTGTTFVQQVLASNKDTLAANGVLFPGRQYAYQLRAIFDVLGRSPHTDRPNVSGHWKALATEIREWPGSSAIISAEALSNAKARSIQRLVSSLAPAEVHMVFTARDLVRVIPAMWQTHMRNRIFEPWASFLASARGDADATSPWGERLWQQQDPRLVFGQWERHVPGERIHVVTVPPSGAAPEVLWERFCAAVGLDPAAYSTDIPRANESLGTAESELLRRVNERVVSKIRPAAYTRWVKVFISREVLEQRPKQRKFGLPAGEYDWVHARSQEIVQFLEQGPYAVTGDLQDLLGPRPSTAVPAPDDIDLDQSLDAAADVIAALLRKPQRKRPRTAGRVDWTSPTRAARSLAARSLVAQRLRSSAPAALGRRIARPARWRSRR